MTFKKEKGLVSIIIPTYNRKKDLDRCLRSVFKQSYKNKEVIVVDDCSSDDTNDYIRRRYLQVKIFVNKKNRGPNYCRNFGTVKSKGEYVLILDSDVELVNKNQIRNMVNIINSDKKIGSLGGCFLPSDKKIRACNLKGPCFIDLEDKHLLKIKGFLLKECDWIGSNNLFMKKELIYKLKGFDESTIGGETEFEVGMNLKQQGFLNLFGKEIAVKHIHSSLERDNIGIESKIAKRYVRETWTTRNRIKYLIKNASVIDKKTKKKIITLNFVRVPKQLISILAFIKQQFLGLKTKDSQTIPSLKTKWKLLFLEILQFFLYVGLMFDSYIWNLIHYKQTIKSKEINFLDKKR
ncbi:MAG: glycosyltransferase family 2 protein [DPANN group archaeon]|nr:glycosyltransferase family 2 protein [DPANN group archaeon]